MAVSLQTLIRSMALRALLAREWWQSGVAYNPLSAAMHANPYAKYAALRSRDPIHWSQIMRAWVVSRYHDVDAVLRDHKRFSNDSRKRVSSRVPDMATSSTSEPSMLFLDPPDHTRLRALVSKAFTPLAIEALETRIQAITEELLDQIDDPACFDVIQSIAYPLPVIVMAELLGVPAQDRVQFKIWSDQRARALEPTLTPTERQLAIRAGEELDAYFLGIIKQRRKEPRADLISSLISVEEQGDTLTQSELLVMLRLLLVAGNETTTNLIGNGLLALLQHPDQMRMLRDDAALMEGAVAEMLRYDPPVQIDARAALEDVEIAGRKAKRGQSVVLLIGAANRDALVFSNPEQFNIQRQEASHISFGRGIHHCLGAPLARLEGRIAFDAILKRFRHLRLLAASPRFKNNLVLRGLETLPVAAK